MSLQQAVRPLRGIRVGAVVALSCADMVWISAAIEALEKAIVAGTAEAVGPRGFRSRKDGENDS